MMDDEQNYIILVAKLKTTVHPKVVGCCRVTLSDKKLQIGDDEEKDIAVEFGLNAVDPDYQSRGIGTLLYDGAIVIYVQTTSCVWVLEDLHLSSFCVLQGYIFMRNVFILIAYQANGIKLNSVFGKDSSTLDGLRRSLLEVDSKRK